MNTERGKNIRTLLYFFVLIAGALLISFTHLQLPGLLLMVIAFLLSVIDGDCP